MRTPKEDEETAGDEGETDAPADVETQIEMRIHEEVNDYRRANDLDPLVFDERLASVAHDHSQDLNDRGYFSYFSPDGDGSDDQLDDGSIDCSDWRRTSLPSTIPRSVRTISTALLKVSSMSGSSLPVTDRTCSEIATNRVSVLTSLTIVRR